MVEIIEDTVKNWQNTQGARSESLEAVFFSFFAEQQIVMKWEELDKTRLTCGWTGLTSCTDNTTAPQWIYVFEFYKFFFFSSSSLLLF